MDFSKIKMVIGKVDLILIEFVNIFCFKKITKKRKNYKKENKKTLTTLKENICKFKLLINSKIIFDDDIDVNFQQKEAKRIFNFPNFFSITNNLIIYTSQSSKHMVFQIFDYAYNTLLDEIAETTNVLKEVFFFHSHHIFESMETKRIKKDLIKKMKKTNSFEEWHSHAQDYDNLTGFSIDFSPNE